MPKIDFINHEKKHHHGKRLQQEFHNMTTSFVMAKLTSNWQESSISQNA